MTTTLLPKSKIPVTAYKTQVLTSHLLNADLSKKQKATLHNLIEIHPKVFPPGLESSVTIRVNIDTLKPYVEYQLYNKHRLDLNTQYRHVEIIVPLDTPPKSTLKLLGIKKVYSSERELGRDVDDMITTFNATKLENWLTIITTLRPMLTHKVSLHKRSYRQQNDLP